MDLNAHPHLKGPLGDSANVLLSWSGLRLAGHWLPHQQANPGSCCGPRPGPKEVFPVPAPHGAPRPQRQLPQLVTCIPQLAGLPRVATLGAVGADSGACGWPHTLALSREQQGREGLRESLEDAAAGSSSFSELHLFRV